MPLDEADKQAIAEMIAAGLTTHAKTQNEEIGKLVDTKLNAGLKPVTEKLDAVEKKANERKSDDGDSGQPAGQGGQGGKGGKGKAGKGKDGDAEDGEPAADPKTAKELADTRAQLEKIEKERKEERETARRDKLRAETRAWLAEAGVPADRLKGAMALIEAEGLVEYDSKGETFGFKGKDKYGADILVPGKAGAAAWLSTDDGKTYLPPKPAGGTGDGAGGQQGSGGGKPPRTEKGALDWGALGNKASAKIGESLSTLD